jgi:hypothetical protein
MKSSGQATNRKITWFAREASADTLDLSPPFQRRPVWTDEQSAYLIDTILHGLPFPEIYMRSETSPAGVSKYEVVDGQQRIRSILAFAQDDLELRGDEIAPSLRGKTFSDLTDAEKSAFWAYDVVTRELSEATDSDIRDLFRRLNIGAVTLNDQELRHAMYKGHFLKLMEKLADDEWWTDMRIVSVRQVRRMEDVEFISELFIALMAGPQEKKSTIDEYYADFESDFPESGKWETAFTRSRDFIESVFEPADIRKWSGKSDFYSLFQLAGWLVESGRKLTTADREKIRTRLMTFRNQVDTAKKRDNTKTFKKSVHSYADAVTRAASDAARRRSRLEILQAEVNDVL